MAEDEPRTGDGIADLHNHVIPGVDDGAVDLDQARDALERMRASGVRTIVASPHVDGSLTRTPALIQDRLAEIDEGWTALTAMAAETFPDLALYRGAEVKLDTPDPDLSDPRLRLAGGQFVLVEFPFMSVPPNSALVISHLRMDGWIPIIAHPERYMGMDPGLETAESWRRSGAHLQVNAGSLVGRYGAEAQGTAMRLLGRAMVDYLASDYHARGRVSLRSTIDLLEELGGAEAAGLLLRVNPARAVAGEAPIPVPPVVRRRRGLLARIAGVFR